MHDKLTDPFWNIDFDRNSHCVNFIASLIEPPSTLSPFLPKPHLMNYDAVNVCTIDSEMNGKEKSEKSFTKKKTSKHKMHKIPNKIDVERLQNWILNILRATFLIADTKCENYQLPKITDIWKIWFNIHPTLSTFALLSIAYLAYSNSWMYR